MNGNPSTDRRIDLEYLQPIQSPMDPTRISADIRIGNT